MKLRYDPYNLYKTSRTPAGLYARQKWLNQESYPAWKSDFYGTVENLYEGQSGDGSWHHSVVETIQRLFGLHLTVRDADERIDFALEWLLSNIIDLEYLENYPQTGKRQPAYIMNLPFVLSRPEILNISATLFLASIFGKSDDPRVVSLYHRMIRNEKAAFWGDPASANNIFRALVVHPQFKSEPIVSEAVGSLRLLQYDQGDWGWRAPFYQTVNALAHLDLRDADLQLEKAFDKLRGIQNTDGSWSDDQPEWNTFLVIHALRNKGLL